MNYAVNLSKKQINISTSSDAGYKIYKKLGFETVRVFDCFG